jgi:hypothetical protein
MMRHEEILCHSSNWVLLISLVTTFLPLAQALVHIGQISDSKPHNYHKREKHQPNEEETVYGPERLTQLVHQAPPINQIRPLKTLCQLV